MVKKTLVTVLSCLRYTLQFSIAISPSLTEIVVPLSSKKSAVNTPCLDFPPNNPSIQEDEEVWLEMDSSCFVNTPRFEIDRSKVSLNPLDLPW